MKKMINFKEYFRSVKPGGLKALLSPLYYCYGLLFILSVLGFFVTLKSESGFSLSLLIITAKAVLIALFNTLHRFDFTKQIFLCPVSDKDLQNQYIHVLNTNMLVVGFFSIILNPVILILLGNNDPVKICVLTLPLLMYDLTTATVIPTSKDLSGGQICFKDSLRPKAYLVFSRLNSIIWSFALSVLINAESKIPVMLVCCFLAPVLLFIGGLTIGFFYNSTKTLILETKFEEITISPEE